MPIDPETYLKVNACLDRCHRSGWDPVEELDRLNLVLTPHQRQEIREQSLTNLLNLIYSWRPAELLRFKYPAGKQCSPTDMYMAICEFIEGYRNKVREEG